MRLFARKPVVQDIRREVIGRNIDMLGRQQDAMERRDDAVDAWIASRNQETLSSTE